MNKEKIQEVKRIYSKKQNNIAKNTLPFFTSIINKLDKGKGINTLSLKKRGR